MWRAHRSSSSPHPRTTSLSCQPSTSAGRKNSQPRTLTWRIILPRCIVTCSTYLWNCLNWFDKVVQQNLPNGELHWRTKSQSSVHLLSTKQNKTCEPNLLPDKHNAFENANFSRTASCGSIWSLRIKFPRSSLVFPLNKERIFQPDTNLRGAWRFKHEHEMVCVDILSYSVINLFILPVD